MFRRKIAILIAIVAVAVGISGCSPQAPAPVVVTVTATPQAAEPKDNPLQEAIDETGPQLCALLAKAPSGASPQGAYEAFYEGMLNSPDAANYSTAEVAVIARGVWNGSIQQYCPNESYWLAK